VLFFRRWFLRVGTVAAAIGFFVTKQKNTKLLGVFAAHGRLYARGEKEIGSCPFEDVASFLVLHTYIVFHWRAGRALSAYKIVDDINLRVETESALISWVHRQPSEIGDSFEFRSETGNPWLFVVVENSSS